MFVRARSLAHTNSRKRDELPVPPVNQCVGMATQLGGNARQNAASEREECTILVFCLYRGEQGRNLMSERGEAGVRCGTVCHQGCSAEIKSHSQRGGVVMHISAQPTSLTIPSAPSGRQKLKWICSSLIYQEHHHHNKYLENVLQEERGRLDRLHLDIAMTTFKKKKKNHALHYSTSIHSTPNHAWQTPTN